jgi:ribosomal protein S6--L-glutamate ligase
MALKIGVIGIAGRWSTDVLAAAVVKATGSCLVIDLGKCLLDFETKSVWMGDINLCTFDAIIVKKLAPEYSPHLFERIEMLYALESAGVRVFSPASAMAALIDRAMGSRRLRDAGIALPPTVLTEDLEAAKSAVRRFGEVVAKPLYSTKARGMRLIRNGPMLHEQLEAFQRDQNPVMYLQKRMALPGRDLGVVFLGGKYLATYARVQAPGAWNTTTADGGRYEAHEPSGSVIEVATCAQAAFGLDFTCVDVLESEAGPLVFEVSAFGGFRGLYDACKIDVAALYVAHVLKQVQHAGARN